MRSLAARVAILTFASLALLLCATVAHAQAPSRRAPHLITVKMVEKNGGASYAYEPASIDAISGDTLRFVQTGASPHDVTFRSLPKGVTINPTIVPYLTNPGQTSDVVLDKRFLPGTYTFVCDPHESLGMKGTLKITAAP